MLIFRRSAGMQKYARSDVEPEREIATESDVAAVLFTRHAETDAR